MNRKAGNVTSPSLGQKAGRASRPFFKASVVTSAKAPSIQRNPKPGSRAGKLQQAKDELKAKYGLHAVSEQNGVAWTTSQLKKMDSLLAKLSPEERKRLLGVTLMLTDKFERKELKGKKFTIAGTTTGTSWVELTASGVGDTTLHEMGHVMHNRAVANAEELVRRSQFAGDLEAARLAVSKDAGRPFVVPADQPFLNDQLAAVNAAAAAVVGSGHQDRKANRQALENAVSMLPIIEPGTPAAQDLAERLLRIQAYVDALLAWSDEKEKVVDPVARLDGFIGIVKKDKLARRSAIFTEYVEAHWPEEPEEFLAEAYKVWVKSPAVVKRISKDLASWFQRGGHLGPKMPVAPVIDELLNQVGKTFFPVVESGRDMIEVIAPPPPIQ